MTVFVVAGFKRCGSSLVMQMLAAGGMDVTGSPPTHETAQAGSTFDAHWIERQKGRVVKILAPNVHPLPKKCPMRSIWLDRDPREQAKSALKMHSTFGGRSPLSGRDVLRKGEAKLRRNRQRAIGAIRSRGPVLEMKFEDILASPTDAATSLAEWFDLEPRHISAMAAVVREK